MRYFENCKTAEALKKAYHKAAARLHPDNGGNEADFKIMKAEYERMFERLKNIHENAAGETYEKDTTETASAFADIIEKVVTFRGVEVEIIGTWIWLTGNTKEYKEAIKAAGFFWSKNKTAWYYNGDTDRKKKHRGYYSMEGLRDKWGTVKVKARADEKKRITA